MSNEQPLNDSKHSKGKIEEMDDLSRYITLVSVECGSSGYTAERESELRSMCDKEPYAVDIHGQHGPAAGPDIGFDIVVFIAQAVASELIVQVFKAAVTQIIKAFRKSKCNDTALGSAEIHARDCVFQIYAYEAACDRNIDYDSLIQQMADFANAERDQGRIVGRIETPCKLEFNDHGCDPECDSERNYSIWRVSYVEGEQWPYAAYDATNKVIIPLNTQHAVGEPFDIFRTKTDE